MSAGGGDGHSRRVDALLAATGVWLDSLWQQRGQLHHQCLPRECAVDGFVADIRDGDCCGVPFGVVSCEAVEQENDDEQFVSSERKH